MSRNTKNMKETIIDSTFDLVVNTMKKKKSLTLAEELELGRLYQESGDIDARNKLIDHNMFCVELTVKQYLNRGVDIDLLFSAAFDGMLTAADKYNPKKGCKFNTIARCWVKKEVLKALDNAKKNREVSSVDQTFNEDEETDYTLLNKMDSGIYTDDLLCREEEVNIVDLVGNLKPKHAQVIRLAYCGEGKRMSDIEIAAQLGCGRENVRKLRLAGENKLREMYCEAMARAAYKQIS